MNKCSKIAKVSYNIFRSICPRRRQMVRVKAYGRHMAEQRGSYMILMKQSLFNCVVHLATHLHMHTYIFILYTRLIQTAGMHCSRRQRRSTFPRRKLLWFFSSLLFLSNTMQSYSTAHIIFDDCIRFSMKMEVRF